MEIGQACQVIILQNYSINVSILYYFKGDISPTWGSCVLLVQSLEMQCYTVTYYNEGDNKTYATDFINMIVDLCENKLGSNEKLNFIEWKPTISSVN